jgi:DnaJ-class molecular chaperone
LSDASKRKHYDMFGSEMNSGGGPNFADINPDEIFRQFFGNGGIEEIFA